MQMLKATLVLGASLLAAPVFAQSAGPAMTRSEAMQLYAAGGFPISADGKNPTNRCGQPAKPRITFVDMNDDKRKEALFVDMDKCYSKDGRWYAIATRDANGQWRQVLEGEGSTAAAGTQFNGWFVLTATSGGKTQRLRYNGTAYVPAEQAVAGAPGGKAQPVRPAPVSTELLFNWVDEQTPEAKALSAAAQAAIYKAAGVKQIAKGKWTGCSEDPSGQSQAQIVMVQDLNSDGKREALIYDSGTFCNGFAGMGSTVLTESAAGVWTVMGSSQGFINFVKSRGVGEYPDIQVGLPGFCFPYLRWNGTSYEIIANLDDKGKPCRPQ